MRAGPGGPGGSRGIAGPRGTSRAPGEGSYGARARSPGPASARSGSCWRSWDALGPGRSGREGGWSGAAAPRRCVPGEGGDPRSPRGLGGQHGRFWSAPPLVAVPGLPVRFGWGCSAARSTAERRRYFAWFKSVMHRVFFPSTGTFF